MSIKKIGVLLDTLDNINTKKDTSFAIMLAAQRRNWEIFFIPSQAIFLQDNAVKASMYSIMLKDQEKNYYQKKIELTQMLTELDAIFFRKDPPFNMEYIYLTYLLEQVAAQGTPVINNPRSIRDANEKLFTTWFPQCCPQTLVSANKESIKAFAREHAAIVIKPLDGMGGQSVFYTHQDDHNLHVIIETVTDQQTKLVMAQEFIPDIDKGDKRLLMINGEPIDYVLARIPCPDDFRGNLAAGASSEARELTERDRWIAQQVGPTLRDKGLYFVGLDIIGDYLTEINVTSPTGVRELERSFDIDICANLLDNIKL